MTVGGILSEAFDLYQRFFARFFLTAAAVFVVVDLFSAIAADVSEDAAALVVVFWVAVALAVAVVGSFWVQGALVAAVRDVRDGKTDTTVGDLYDAVRPQLPALIAAGILAGIGIAVGLFLLIVPGLYLLTRWILLAPVIVLERRSAGEAFRRSAELVRGHGWKVLGLIVVTLLISGIAQQLLVALFAFLPDFLRNWFGGVVAHSLATPFVALSWTLLYYLLLAEREPEAAVTAPA